MTEWDATIAGQEHARVRPPPLNTSQLNAQLEFPEYTPVCLEYAGNVQLTCVEYAKNYRTFGKNYRTFGKKLPYIRQKLPYIRQKLPYIRQNYCTFGKNYRTFVEYAPLR